MTIVDDVDDDAMTIADDVDDDAKHRRREDESSSSAENVRTTTAPREASGERIVASKALDWGGLTVRTGNFGGGGTAVATSDDPPTEGEDEEEDQEGVGHRSSPPVLRCRGGGKLRFRVFQKRRPRDALERRSARQDVVVSLGGGISVDVEPISATRIIVITDAMTRKGPVEGGDDDDGADNNDFFVDALCDDENDDDDDDDDRGGAAPEEEEGGKGGRPGTTTTTTGVPEYVLTDEFSREAYDRIMRQYTEARHYARAAGGVLIRRSTTGAAKAETTISTGTTTMSAVALEATSRLTRSSTRTTTRLLLLDRGRWGGHTGRGGGRTSEGRGGRWSPRHDDSGDGSDYGDD